MLSRMYMEDATLLAPSLGGRWERSPRAPRRPGAPGSSPPPPCSAAASARPSSMSSSALPCARAEHERSG